jgi:hypothetical protein
MLRVLSAQDLPFSQLSQRLLQTGYNFHIESSSPGASLLGPGIGGCSIATHEITRSEPA